MGPRLRTIDSALVEQALRRVVTAVHAATQLVARLNSRFEQSAAPQGLAARAINALATSALSVQDNALLSAAHASLRDAIAYMLQTIPTVTGLQVKAQVDHVAVEVSAIMAMMNGYSKDKAQTEERSKRLQELQLQASDIRLNAVIGEGGFSVVYTGVFHNNQVACKVVRRKDGSRLSSIEREAVENELIMTRYLADPNILHWYVPSLHQYRYAPI